ncbi:hypothetical protein JK636_19060 [Clostridium sp. YIM B02515]|uniref:Uncharacterized protein n=1 Tax=Clostridium rhizosphaerae TaxID=2803861 RepID=A0ABS1TEU5_9CLOT|nr:hypothetical protein [Clostridium rhizosphaerae]MBL4937810.1 hypothetical protein [Clostridium rhizosphaerae]
MKKKNYADVESLDAEDFDDDGFSEGEINLGKAIASFSFAALKEEQSTNAPAAPSIDINKPAASRMPIALRFITSQRGATPAVDGELYTMKRCYQFRPSTIRKLNELKANHSDVNAYLNTIIDEAISHYYYYVFSNKSN